MNFYKMNGLGNDYIFFNALDNVSLTEYIIPYIPYLSDRNFGIGGDGVITIEPSSLADCRMRMFNIDSSEGMMCGNGIRELAKLVWEKDWIKKNPLLVETGNGVLSISMDIKDDKMLMATVDMGSMNYKPIDLPFNSPDGAKEKGIYTFTRFHKEQNFLFYTGMIGSKHTTCFIEQDVKTFEFCSLGQSIEKDKVLFPEGVNVEFVNIISQKKVLMRVWERGSGHTLACGTGATFVVGLGMDLGYLDKDAEVEVILERGSLFISKKDNMMIMKGSADLVYEGKIDFNQFNY